METVAIGVIRTSWGVKGWLKLASFSGEWEHFSDIESVELRKGAHSRTFHVEGFRLHQGAGMFKLTGIETPEAGKSLSGWEIHVPQGHAAILEDDEWYLKDLVGLSMTVQGESLGTIVGVVESADDLLEVEKPEGRRFFVPFREIFVGEPNLKQGTIELLAPWLSDE